MDILGASGKAYQYMQVFVFFMLLVTKDIIINRDWGRSKKVQQLVRYFSYSIEFKVGRRKIIMDMPSIWGRKQMIVS